MEIRSPLVIDSDSICIFQAQNTIDKMFLKFRRLPRLSAPLAPHTGLSVPLASKIPAWARAASMGYHILLSPLSR